MGERSFYSDILKGARADGWLLLRLQDTTTEKRPADFMGTCPNGRAVLVEVKWAEETVRPDKPVPRKWFAKRKHQVTWLRQFDNRALGIGLVVVFTKGDRQHGRVIRLPLYDDCWHTSTIETLTLGWLQLGPDGYTGWNKLDVGDECD